MTDNAYGKLRYAYPNSPFTSFKVARTRVEFLAVFKPVHYDCCVSSCCCFVGPHAELSNCPYCNQPRFNSKGHARKRFTYVPLIPRLVAYYKNHAFARDLQYRSQFRHEAGVVKDVMDSRNYSRLRETYVTVNGHVQPYKYFSDDRDIALGLSTDGFCPFKRRKQTCWPLLMFNYNLPPEVHFWLRHTICLGVIPGPKKPKDFDSFLWPVVEELLELAKGVKAYDVLTSEVFALQAYLILIFGDMPAVSMVMCMKGHNGLFPCCMCMVRGLQIPGANSTTHYVPLERS